ncbi:MAG TPA: DHH family phosphoesterase, partial [Lachnoclostridium sp.]|nr:DHH family phosphoesterase [Lachnoclostridium sp.]
DVSKVAFYCGSGGQKKADRCTMAGRVHDIINNLSNQIAKQLN